MSNRLGKKIAELLKDRRLKQKELAEAVGLDEPQISKIINGKSGTTPANIVHIAKFLLVPPVELLSLLDDIEINMQDPMLLRIVNLYSSLESDEDRELFLQMAEFVTRRKRRDSYNGSKSTDHEEGEG